MDVIIELNAINNTLNLIHVSGEDDLNRMLGCIQHLKAVIVELNKPAEVPHENADAE